ncbi:MULTISPECIES: helix-hairpin-helix domain-containing protein [unclassified Lebetimonas]|uniref:helix-hairpin-helix domain-containing protein n=1 Tax=unclassified Lebetimonas TaxID=2648158 RepID=UPI0004B4F383|nr:MULTISPECIES: helix-hairpin-helix domain-containing protein [unclassified Lebetimonas]
MSNSEIAKILSLTADLLDIKGENPFKVRAYRNAARLVEGTSKDFEKLVKEEFDLTKLPGIGHDLSEYIKEIVITGKFSKLEELKKQIPLGLIDMLSIEGLGPKRIKEIYDAFHITSLEELRKYAQNGELDKLPGFGPKLIEKILKGVKQLKKAGIRFLWADVEEVAEEIRKYLLDFPGVEIVDIAGSYRRRKETVGDLDILVIADDYMKVSEYFTKYKRVKEVYSKGLTRSTVFLDNSLQIDLRAVTKESYGSALHYFTGSKAHNIAIRKMAIDMGLKVNEYGIYKGTKRIAGKSEEEVYETMGLRYIEPELRENRGEIEAAKNNNLPKLVREDDIKGDLKVYFNKNIKEIIDEAEKKGYEFLGICTKNIEDLEKIKKLKSKLKIYSAIECKIDKNGELNYLKDKIKDFDIVYGSVEDNFNLDKPTQTKRIINALNHIDILSHPICRKIQEFDGIDIEFEQILKAAKEKNKIFEIDARRDRLDLDDSKIKLAKETGVRMCINSYATNKKELYNMKYGLNQSRRGWAEKKDLINTLKNFI